MVNLMPIPAAASTDEFMISVLANDSSEVAERFDSRLLCLVQNTENQEEAEEAVREAFQRAYEQLEKFREESRFLTDVIHNVLNESVRKLRR